MPLTSQIADPPAHIPPKNKEARSKTRNGVQKCIRTRNYNKLHEVIGFLRRIPRKYKKRAVRKAPEIYYPVNGNTIILKFLGQNLRIKTITTIFEIFSNIIISIKISTSESTI